MISIKVKVLAKWKIPSGSRKKGGLVQPWKSPATAKMALAERFAVCELIHHDCVLSVSNLHDDPTLHHLSHFNALLYKGILPAY